MPRKAKSKEKEIPLVSVDAGLSLDKKEPIAKKEKFPVRAFIIDQEMAENFLRNAWQRVIGKCDNVVYLGKHKKHKAVIRHAINALKAGGTLYLPKKLSKFVENLEEAESEIKGFVAFRRS